MTIREGQEYLACRPTRSRPDEHYTRIRVMEEPNTYVGSWGFGKVDIVTVLEDGREVRRRAIEMSQLHATGTTKDGQPRRDGYRLVKDTEGAR